MADIKDFKHAIVRQKILDAVRKDLIGPASDQVFKDIILQVCYCLAKMM